MAASTPRFALAIALITSLPLAACGSAPPKEADDILALATPAPTQSKGSEGSSEPSGATAGGSSSEGGSRFTEDQKKQMEIALRRGGEKAANCADVVADAKRGEGEVRVVFDGQKGRATDVTVGAPWAGTSVESCIKRAFVGEIVLRFDGDPIEVPYAIKLPEKKAPPADDKGKKDDVKGEKKDEKKGK